MNAPSPSIIDLARRLLAVRPASTDPDVAEPELVIEKLRISLTRFAGTEGFVSLLRRALTLASADLPCLRNVTVDEFGRLKGTEHLAVETAAAAGHEAAVALTAHLLGLLVTFVGEPITLRLVREAWPDALLENRNSTSGKN